MPRPMMALLSDTIRPEILAGTTRMITVLIVGNMSPDPTAWIRRLVSIIGKFRENRPMSELTMSSTRLQKNSFFKPMRASTVAAVITAVAATIA